MNAQDFTRLVMEAISLGLLLSAPVFAVCLLVALAVGALQSSLHLQDASVQQLPRLVAGAIALSLALGWMSAELVHYTSALWDGLTALSQ